jgi:sortase A
VVTTDVTTVTPADGPTESPASAPITPPPMKRTERRHGQQQRGLLGRPNRGAKRGRHEKTVQPLAENTRPRTGPPRPGVLSIALALVMVVCVVAAFFGVFAFGLSGLQEQRSQHLLYAELRGLLAPASQIAPWIGGKIPEGAPIALLNAPEAHLVNTVVVEGTTSGDLLAGPGHLPNTPLPGQPGNVVVLGKSATAGAPFAHLTSLRQGDLIHMRTGQGVFTYRVRGFLVNGGRLPRIPVTSGLLLLGTAKAGGQFGAISARHLIYVVASLEGKAVVAPPGSPHSVPTTQLPGHNEPAAWLSVALWTALLLAASAACWWLWARWGLLRTWIVGAPVLLAVLWFLSNAGLRLLPNVY